MADITDYTGLITSQHAHKPRFVATVETSTEAQVDGINELDSLSAKFDVDTALGMQLDIIGEWVGVSREVKTPITGVYFAWDDTDATGWDSGAWQGVGDPDSGIIVLPDDAYRFLIKAKIAVNSWDGTIDSAYDVWETLFKGDVNILIVDNQDMTMSIIIIGGFTDAISEALITGGYINLKPSGVLVTYSTASVFAWDADTGAFAGWDDGSWVTGS